MRTLPSVPFLKPTGQDKPGSQFAMDLALGGARADRRPGHQVGDVLRRRHVEEFGAGGQAEIVDRGKHVAGEPQAPVDVEAAVEVGIVDQPLPSDRGARLLEIDPHHDLEAVGELFAQGGEALGVFHRRQRDRGPSRGRRRPAGGRRHDAGWR